MLFEREGRRTEIALLRIEKRTLPLQNGSTEVLVIGLCPRVVAVWAVK